MEEDLIVEWHPLSEKPRHGAVWLSSTKDNYTFVGYFADGRFHNIEGDCEDASTGTTHWAYIKLPKPYKETHERH